MNTRIIGILLVSIMCITVAVSAAAAQSAPFVINGYVSDSNNVPCNGPAVQITKLNAIVGWDAENDSESNYYRLVLESDDVSAGNILRFEASGCSESKMVNHTVTQSELEDGGINGFDIVFDAPQEIIWQGDVTLINGTTFDKTAHNSGVSYEINRTTALGALDAAAEEGVFNYTMNDEWYEQYGSLFVDSIADIPSEGWDGWMYWVNYPEDLAPMVGADQFVLEDGDVVTWYWSSSMDMTPADSPMIVNVSVAIEEPQEIIWQGDVTLINGTTFDKTAHNSGVSYEINRTTALGALDAAAEEGVFNYTMNDEWYEQYGSLFVDSIADIPSEGWDGWMYWVNYPEDLAPMVGADQFVLEDGDVVTWYWSSSMEMTPANSSMLVKINITPPEPDPTDDDDDNGGSSSSSSSSGGGASGELFENIVCSETDRQYVYSNSDITYSYELECNIVQFVKFTSMKSAGQVATKVEILEDTSTLVDNPPSDIVYKNLNIWVGNAGWATERNIDDATVVFTVEKSWITENNIDESSIALYRYSDDTWHELVTRKIAEDANSLQFEAETPGFSPFAVTGKELEGEPGGEGVIAEPTITAEKTPAPTPTEEKGIPGFGIFAGLSVLLIAVRLLREKK